MQSAARRGAPTGTTAAAAVRRVRADQGETELRDPATDEIIGIVDAAGVDRFPTTQAEFDAIKNEVRAALAAGGGADAAVAADQAAAMAANAEQIASDATAPTATSELAEPAPETAPAEVSDEYVASDPGYSGGGGYDGGYGRSSGSRDYETRRPARSYDDDDAFGRAFTLDDFLEAAGGDREQAARMAAFANRRRRGTRGRDRDMGAGGFWDGFPFNRPPSPIRSDILATLDAAFAGAFPTRGR